jgi:hypothetical protein
MSCWKPFRLKCLEEPEESPPRGTPRRRMAGCPRRRFVRPFKCSVFPKKRTIP